MGPESVPGRLEQAFGPAYLPLDAWKTEYNRCCGLLAGRKRNKFYTWKCISRSIKLSRRRTHFVCMCVCFVFTFLFFFPFFVIRKGLSLSREHLPLLVVSM